MLHGVVDKDMGKKTRLLAVAVGLVSLLAGVHSAVASPSDAMSRSPLAKADTQRAEATSSPTEAEVGLRFKLTVDGRIRAIRILRLDGDVEAHQVSLWSPDHSRLATKTAVPAGPGWQEVALDEPVSVKAGRPYVASYRTRTVAVTQNYFKESRHPGPFVVNPSQSSVYNPTAGDFPGAAEAGTNYWVDPVFVGR